MERKFGEPGIAEKLRKFAFLPGNYSKVNVSGGWDDDVPESARKRAVELWDFRKILRQIADQSQSVRTYFTDDTMRALLLLARATESDD